MANAASLLLPGSNLTNLIVLAHEHVTGSTFAARLAPAWAVSVAVTILFLAVVFRRSCARSASGRRASPFRPEPDARRRRRGRARPRALEARAPVLALGVAVALVARVPVRTMLRRRTRCCSACSASPCLGTLARDVHLGHLLEHAGRWETAWLAAGAALVVNNLPAAACSRRTCRRTRARYCSASTSARTSRSPARSRRCSGCRSRAREGARPSIVRYSLLGVALVPLSLALAARRLRPSDRDDRGLRGVVRISAAARRGSRSRNVRAGSPSTGRPGVRSSLTRMPPGSRSARSSSQRSGRRRRRRDRTDRGRAAARDSRLRAPRRSSSPASRSRAFAARSGSRSTVTTKRAVSASAAAPSPNAVPSSATSRPVASARSSACTAGIDQPPSVTARRAGTSGDAAAARGSSAGEWS